MSPTLGLVEVQQLGNNVLPPAAVLALHANCSAAALSSYRR
jgi:hypothetical protein